MAAMSDYDALQGQISKDGKGSEGPIPLSPQWLLPKPGENKTGMTEESHINANPGNVSRSDTIVLPGAGEMRDNKKRDVFRPSILDMESGRHDRWRDEERDTNFSVRRDRRREGDREIVDNRKVDRWPDSSGKNFEEARRASSERWSDSSNRESNYEQRRESKWNTRWGPDDKEADSLREKWTDSSKDPERSLDRGLSHLNYLVKDERDSDHYRPWRSTASHSRGRVEPPHHQSSSSNKQFSAFVHGRGRGETVPPTFSLGRGRVSSGGNSMKSMPTQSNPLGSSFEKVESGHGELSPLRYSRTRLLAVYRMTDVKSCPKLFDGVLDVPSITQDESLEPLAFCTPTSEELVILKGIDNEDIVSSGAPQITKDGSVGRNSSDPMQSRRTKLGSRDDLSLDGADNKDVQMLSDLKLNNEATGEDGDSCRQSGEVLMSRESSTNGKFSVRPGAIWRSPSMREHTQSAVNDWRDNPADHRSRTSDISWLESKKDLNNEWDSSLADSSHFKDGSKWQTCDGPVVKRQPSAIFDSKLEASSISQPLPEDLVLFYKDPNGDIQGPFSGSDIIGWFEVGYFGIDLQVRLASAPHNSPFSLLGDVMPHLRAKACPPPGFGAPKQNEMPDVSGRSNTSSFGKLPAGSSEVDMMQHDPRYRHGSTTDVQNRFLESLMTGNKNGSPPETFSRSEGMQGYYGNNSGIMPPLGAEGEDNLYLLAKKLTLDREKSLSNPFPFWPGRDAATVSPKPDIVHDSSMLHSKLLPLISDNSRQQPHSQNVDLLSLLQGLPDRSTSGVNSSASSWANFPVQGGLSPLQNKLEMHHGQNIPPQAAFGIQQQRLQPHNPPSSSNLLVQAMDNSAGLLASEKLLSSGICQDPQILNLLQQQSRSQLNSKAPIPSQQQSLLDQLLLLKQQQQIKEEQQQLVWQQQQLLSQLLSENHSQQRFKEQSYAQLQAAGLPAGNTYADPRLQQQILEMSPVGSQMQVPSMQDEIVTNLPKLSPAVSHDFNHNVVRLPHQITADSIPSNGWGAIVPEQVDQIHLSGATMTSGAMDPVGQTKLVEKPLVVPITSASDLTENFVRAEHLVDPVAVPLAGTNTIEVPIPEQINNLNFSQVAEVEEPLVEREECIDHSPSINEVKIVESGEVRKASEKKSKKQRSSKAQSSDQAKGVSKAQPPKQPEIEGAKIPGTKSDVHNVPEKMLSGPSVSKKGENKFDAVSSTVVVDFQHGRHLLPAQAAGDHGQAVDDKVGSGQTEYVPQLQTRVQTGTRAWKPAPGFKPKSLLEIQQEEQRKAQIEMEASRIAISHSNAVNSDHKSSRELQQDAGSSVWNLGKSESSLNQNSMKSQWHDLLAEDVSAKPTGGEMEVPGSSSVLLPVQATSSQSVSVDDDNFIEAKDTKKSRRKAGKAKGAGANVSVPIASLDASIGSSPIEKAKSSRQVHEEKEVLPTVPSGPSLGDFVVWKGDSTSPSPAPAWLTDSGKLPKATSLRDILKEQEKKVSSGQRQVPLPTTQKSLPSQSARGNGPTWSSPSSSSSKVVPATKVNVQASTSQSKHKGDDDLFWGPLDPPKQEAKQSDFSHTASQISRETKSVNTKGTPTGSLNRQKSASGRNAEHSLSSSPASGRSSLKGKNNASNKHSEAMDFRDWCESEFVRLVGSKETDILEYCLKQSRSEAESILIENLGSLDPDHEFIEKFLNYKDFLPADVLEMAFGNLKDRKVDGSVPARGFDNDGLNIPEQCNSAGVPDESTKGGGGGKKKGKKGKKVSPSVFLGFNVVSNRIMKGEIQAVED